MRISPASIRTTSYATTFFARFLTFAHLFFAALAIAALPAADRTRFFTPTTSRSVECPTDFAALVLRGYLFGDVQVT